MNHLKHLLTVSAATLIMTFGCAESLTTSGNPTTSKDKVVVSTSADDGTEVSVDSSLEDSWVYISLDQKAEVQESDVWDLGFQRFKIKSNGGISGNGGVEVAALKGESYDSLTEAPATGYTQDAVDSDDEDTDPDYAFLGPNPWYDYDLEEHVLTPANIVYVVKSASGNYFKLQLLGYYDDAGTGGYPKFRFDAIAPPPANTDPEVLKVNATEKGTWVYVVLSTRRVIEVDDPATSADWDIAVSRTDIKTNGGTSGSGWAGAMELVDADWASVTSVNTVGFLVDEMVPGAGPPGTDGFSGSPVLNTWWDYDMTTHKVSPRDAVFAARGSGGDYFKLKIEDYADGVMTFRIVEVTRKVETISTTIEASEDDDWRYLSFRTGQWVQPGTPEGNLSWDIGFSNTYLKTNSGTSGAGEGGALAADSPFDELTHVPLGHGCYLPAEGHVCDCELTEPDCGSKSGIWTPKCACEAPFAVDEMITVSDEGDTYSGNPILTDWYNESDGGEAIVPKEMSFIVRTADGSLVKMHVTEYADGTMTVDWAYAGPGHDAF